VGVLVGAGVLVAVAVEVGVAVGVTTVKVADPVGPLVWVTTTV
jgi:hypothetical protein